MPTRPILVVDDEPYNLAVFSRILEPEYRLVFARNGAEALSAVAKHNPRLILLDIQMPDMDGYDICKALKANAAISEIPVIFVTTLNDSGNEEMGFAVGCVDYLIKPVIPSIVRARVRTHLSLVQLAKLEKSHRDAIYMLGEVGHFNDDDTGDHIWRMAAYSSLLAKELGWKTQDVELLGLAAPMHDTGKIGIPDAILRKPGKLDEAEWQVMRRHCAYGRQILSKSNAPVFVLAAEVAMYHHERWDGSGYPENLAGLSIPESARIVAIADVFDALTTARPYKQPWPPEKAFQEIRQGAGRHFDPDFVACFVNMQPKVLETMRQWNS
jgi:putative two-component system response regulator